MYSVRKESVKNKEFTLIEVSRKTIKMTFMDYGAAVLSIHVPDSFGKMETVLLAYEKLDSYIENSLCLNATIGPISGRISNAKFKINDIEYSLEKNFLGTTNLHGGSECFAYKIFDYKIIETSEKTQLIFTYKKEEVRTNGYAREEENKKGMDSMQLTGATSTYARKYAQNAMFLIDDTRDSDATNNHDKEEQVQVKQTPAPLVVLNESNIDYAIKNNKQEHLLSLINVKYSATNEQMLRLKEVY